MLFYIDEMRAMLEITNNKNDSQSIDIKSALEDNKVGKHIDKNDVNDDEDDGSDIDGNGSSSNSNKGDDNHHHHRRRCDGCKEARLIHYLIRNRTWSYFRIAIDGMKSIVFHNPSPTWCIASAHIWYDDDDDDDDTGNDNDEDYIINDNDNDDDYKKLT